MNDKITVCVGTLIVDELSFLEILIAVVAAVS